MKFKQILSLKSPKILKLDLIKIKFKAGAYKALNENKIIII